MYYAHSTTDESQANWQLLHEHLIDTAERAERFGRPMGLAKAARLAGLLHDLGKYNPEFQARLAAQRSGLIIRPQERPSSGGSPRAITK
jgi:CRISPR-associated endonuclease/helicase Cas3